MKKLAGLLVICGLIWYAGCSDDMAEINAVWNEITLDELKAVYAIDFTVDDLHIERTLKEEKKGFFLYDIAYEGTNQQRMTGYLTIPKVEDPSRPFPLIYYFPRARETKEAAVTLADLVSSEGWAVFATDKPKTPLQKESELVSELLVAAESQQAAVKNGLRGITALKNFKDIDGDRIIAMGGSFGTTPTLILTALDPRIKMGITVVGSAGRMEEQALLQYRPIYKQDLKEKLIEIKSAEPLFFLPLIGKKPMLIINAKYDQNIKNVFVEKLQNGIQGPKKILIVDRDHIFPLKIIITDVMQWIRENMQNP